MSINVFTNLNNIRININYQSLTFAAGEKHLQLLETERHGDSFSHIHIIGRIRNSDEVVELMLLVNALRHRYGQALKIDLTLPYLPYSRQDRVCAPGQAFSLEVFANILNSLRLNQIITWDCHSPVGLTLLNAHNIEPETIIAQCPDLVRELTDENSILVCPDQGATQRCQGIHNFFELNHLLKCQKKRNPKNGKIETLSIPEAPSLKGKTAVITDDICDGGFTFIKLAEQLKTRGAQTIILYVTHGFFSRGLEVFDGLIDKIYTSNSIDQNNIDQNHLKHSSHNLIHNIQFSKD